jgi:hypothetical protein
MFGGIGAAAKGEAAITKLRYFGHSRKIAWQEPTPAAKSAAYRIDLRSPFS